MKKLLFTMLVLFSLATASGQRQTGLLWEITGKGMTKPSYVYGTMHVSDKMAFHLGDPFFKAIQSVDIVALEQNLDSVYDDWLRMYSNMIRNNHGANYVDYETYELSEYEKNTVMSVMLRGPFASNAILYRVSQLQMDYQEETYLDMLIYRLGKKYKKQIAGVEDFLEAEKLTTLATAKNVRRKDAIGSDDGDVLADYYINGDLTAIDSLNRVMYSETYNDYMLYKRNQNMVNAMVKLMAKGSLFTGVGCAHLPGTDGVLKLLENMGYTVKPVKYKRPDKPSKYLDKSKKIKVSQPMLPQTSADKFFTANMPAPVQPIYFENRKNTLYVSLDIPAGAQYLVYRYQDFPYARNKKPVDVLESIDSFLFDVILGKQDKKTVIRGDEALGSQSIGFDVEFTRSNGDKGRLKIFHTGSEIVLAEVNGIGNFAAGKEAADFFNSFRLLNAGSDKMITMTSPDGILSFMAPAAKNAAGQIAAFRPDGPEFNYNRTYQDKSYFSLYRNVYNGLRLNPDTMELLLSCESFAYSNKLMELSSEYKPFAGYPARYTTMKDKEGNKYLVRAVLRGYKYFLQAVKGESASFNDEFFTSLKFNNPQVTGTERTITDTFGHYSCMSPLAPSRDNLSIQMEIIREQQFTLENSQYAGIKRLTWFSPENDREFIEISYTKYSRYDQYKDSSKYWDAYLKDVGYTNLEIISKKKTNHDYGTRLDVIMGDTGCSRRVTASYILHGDEFVSAIGFYDTITGMGNFTKRFMETFRPVASSKENLFASKVKQWTEDINSSDSSVRRKAWNGFENLYVDSNNVDYLVKVLDTMHTSNQLVEHKRSIIYRLGSTRCQRMIPVLEKIYRSAGDTSAFQTAVIGSLASLKSKASYAKIKELFFEETPVPDSKYSFNIKYAINDSLLLAAGMFPELFDKIDIDEYKDNIIEFATLLVDSNKLKPETYKSKVADLQNEANILVKKVLSSESSKKVKSGDYSGSDEYEQLTQYIRLLVPFKEDPKVKTFLDKAKTIKQRDKRLEIYVLLLKHKYEVDDSVFTNLGTEREFKSALYRELKEINRLDKFPKSSMNKALYSVDAYYMGNRYKYVAGTSTEIDQISLVDSTKVRYWDWKDKSVKEGWVYVVKYNRKKKKSSYEEDEDNAEKEQGPTVSINKQYYLAIAGPQPFEKDSFNGTRMLMSTEKEQPITPESKQSELILKLVRMSQIDLIRPGFYGYEWNNRFYASDDED